MIRFSKLRFLLFLAFAVIGGTPLWGTAVQWDSGTGHTDHWYEVFTAPQGIYWEGAEASALAGGGYLATILSAEENAFVFALVDSPSYWVTESLNSTANLGPWLGGYQVTCSPEPACGWTWLNGDGAFAYTNWHDSEPNDGWTGESRLQYFEYSGRSNKWNDIGASNQPRPEGFAEPIAYVVEYNSDPAAVPEPASLLLVGAGLLIIARRLQWGNA